MPPTRTQARVFHERRGVCVVEDAEEEVEEEEDMFVLFCLPARCCCSGVVESAAFPALPHS
jgi:hypothetical protein